MDAHARVFWPLLVWTNRIGGGEHISRRSFVSLVYRRHHHIMFYIRVYCTHRMYTTRQRRQVRARGSSINESSHWLATDIAISSISHPNTSQGPTRKTAYTVRFVLFCFIYFLYIYINILFLPSLRFRRHSSSAADITFVLVFFFPLRFRIISHQMYTYNIIYTVFFHRRSLRRSVASHCFTRISPTVFFPMSLGENNNILFD